MGPQWRSRGPIPQSCGVQDSNDNASQKSDDASYRSSDSEGCEDNESSQGSSDASSKSDSDVVLGADGGGTHPANSYRHRDAGLSYISDSDQTGLATGDTETED